MQDALRREIWNTLADIKAEIHTRLVFGLGCIPVIMIGIGMGIMFKGGHLLTAFGISSVPAGFLIVCIMMGKSITKNRNSLDVSGIMLMWMAIVVLCRLSFGIYRKLLRN